MIALGAVSIVTLLSLNARENAAYAEADHARNLQLDLAELSKAMLDQETGLRGYVATGNPQFLQSYDAGRGRLPLLEARLRAEIPSARRPALEQLFEAITKWQAWAEARKGQVVPPSPNFNPAESAKGKQLFDVIRSDESVVNEFAASQARAEFALAERRSRAQLRSILTGSGAALVLLLMLAAILLLGTLRPTSRLAQVAAQLAAGRNVDVPFKERRNEIGSLARALDKWRREERERAELAATMAAVSERVELDDVLETAATRILSIVDADEVVITLLTPDGEFQVATAQPKPFTAGTVLPAESPGGQALREGRPVITDLRSRAWDPAIEAWRDEHDFGPAMAIPLVSGGRMHGVATVLRRHGSEAFSDSDVGRAVLIMPYLAAATEVSRVFAGLHASNVELERAGRVKSAFLASMSHELRTPLNSILGFSQLLLETPAFAEDSDRRTRYLGNINTSGRHLLNLINDILDLSKIEAGKFELRLERCEVSSLAAPALSMVEPLAAAKQIELQSDIQPGIEVVADGGRIKQVLINLLSNAVKFTPDGGRVRLTAAVAEGTALIQVVDTGIGIPREDRDRIFEDFQQIQSSRTQGMEGTGLGLALARRFVELHGGSIKVDSDIGRGSTFTVSLPMHTDAERRTRRAGPPDPSAPEVLVIEDDPASGALIAEYLAKGGYRSVVVPTGGDGVRLARELSPVVITLDIVLTDYQDFTVLRQLKDDPRTRSIPVVVVSVSDDRAAALALGAVDHLVKPVDSHVLVEVVTRHASGGRQERPVVLIVDDDPAVRALAGKTLASSGYGVLEADAGEAALELVRACRPDVILLDLMMPVMSGFEVIARLRADAGTADIPIIVLTSKSLDAEERRYLDESASAVFSKVESPGLWCDLVGWLHRLSPRSDAQAAGPG